MGGPLSRGPWPRGHRRGPELRAHVCDAHAQGQNRSARRRGLGGGLPAHRLSDPQRHVRGRLVVRDAIVRTRTRYISLIRTLLRQHGYRVPSGSAENFVRRVQNLPLPGRVLSVVAPLLALMPPLNRQLTYCDERIEHLAVQDPRVSRLRSVPGIGPVTAAAFLAAIDDAQRFHHAHQLEAYRGPVLREYSSGETQRRGRSPRPAPRASAGC